MCIKATESDTQSPHILRFIVIGYFLFVIFISRLLFNCYVGDLDLSLDIVVKGCITRVGMTG